MLNCNQTKVLPIRWITMFLACYLNVKTDFGFSLWLQDKLDNVIRERQKRLPMSWEVMIVQDLTNSLLSEIDWFEYSFSVAYFCELFHKTHSFHSVATVYAAIWDSSNDLSPEIDCVSLNVDTELLTTSSCTKTKPFVCRQLSTKGL